MIVPLKLYVTTGGIDCLSASCQFRKTCANHESAGDFRVEDGFKPKLKFLESVLSGYPIQAIAGDCFSANSRILDNEAFYPDDSHEVGSLTISEVLTS